MNCAMIANKNHTVIGGFYCQKIDFNEIIQVLKQLDNFFNV